MRQYRQRSGNVMVEMRRVSLNNVLLPPLSPTPTYIDTGEFSAFNETSWVSFFYYLLN